MEEFLVFFFTKNMMFFRKHHEVYFNKFPFPGLGFTQLWWSIFWDDLRYLLHSYRLKLRIAPKSCFLCLGVWGCIPGFASKNQFDLSMPQTWRKSWMDIVKNLLWLIPLHTWIWFVSRRSLWRPVRTHNSPMIIWTTCCFKLFSLIFLCTWLVHQNSSRSVNLSGFDDFGDGFLDQTGSNGPYAGTMYAKTWNRSLASHFVGRAGVLHVFSNGSDSGVRDLESGLVHFRWWI